METRLPVNSRGFRISRTEFGRRGLVCLHNHEMGHFLWKIFWRDNMTGPIHDICLFFLSSMASFHTRHIVERLSTGLEGMEIPLLVDVLPYDAVPPMLSRQYECCCTAAASCRAIMHRPVRKQGTSISCYPPCYAEPPSSVVCSYLSWSMGNSVQVLTPRLLSSV